MKLKKLIPLAGMTGIAAVVAPLLGSCANKGTEIVWNKGDDLPEVGTPSTTSFKNTDEATKAYFEAINNDKTLLSKDILLHDYNVEEIAEDLDIESVSSISVRTDNVNTDEQKVSYVNKVECKTLLYGQTTGTYEAKNVEFCITQVSVTEPTAATITYFQPKIMMEVEAVAAAIESKDPAKIASTVETVMNHAEELARDKTWYMYSSIECETYTTSQRIDASNVYEYAYSSSYLYDVSLVGFANASTYFDGIEITGGK